MENNVFDLASNFSLIYECGAILRSSPRYDLIPDIVVEDVLKRIFDWTSSGGSIEDDYVKRQISYALKFAKEDSNE